MPGKLQKLNQLGNRHRLFRPLSHTLLVYPEEETVDLPVHPVNASGMDVEPDGWRIHDRWIFKLSEQAKFVGNDYGT
ncbi:MAG: hypothetical protein R3C20_01590 [Planctomycetaceae bacterium]